MTTLTSLEDVPLTDTWRGPSTVARLDTIKIGKVNTDSKRRLIELEHNDFVIWPWNKNYRYWWGLTVLCGIITVFTEPYAMAFAPAGRFSYSDALSIIEYTLTAILFLDLITNFFMAYYDKSDKLIIDKKEIAIHYLKGLFWLDLGGIFPFHYIALGITGEFGKDNDLASYLSLLRLIKLVRLYRLKELFDIVQYNPHVSLIMLTLVRNLGFATVWSHFAACIFYFIARKYDFDSETTWIGGSFEGLNDLERYVTSLYWSVTTFTTTGYGDYSPQNAAEQIWGVIYMLLNMVAHAWIIGSITLLIVKQDKKTGDYRESIQTLRHYAKVHGFPRKLEKKLRGQLQLEFNNREISDEHVLGNFPAETRRKVLRKLYLPSLMQTTLMRGIRQQFVDAFLTSCKVEIFSAGDEIMQRGAISSDLYLLVAGSAELMSSLSISVEQCQSGISSSQAGGTTMADSRIGGVHSKVNNGEFINAISFFTESPQAETIRTKTVCKTLTMSRTVYKMISEDYPASVTKLLQNLLENVEESAKKGGEPEKVSLPTKLAYLRAGSMYPPVEDDSSTDDADFHNAMASIQAHASLTAVRDIVQMHLNKMKDEQTTRFLNAASRDDAETIDLMCDQGFDPNAADYEHKTALMVAATQGSTEVVETILKYDADPNLVDIHGSSALYQAAINGHDDAMALLLEKGAELRISEADAANRACQAVFERNLVTLRRLLKAGLPVNAGDYDKRRPAHVAAAEGSVAALQLLVEFGADLTVKDRWSRTVEDEAKSVGAGQVLEYLESLKNSER